MLRAIDLFSGIGGVRIAFQNAGFKNVFSNDNDANCKTTYDLNFFSNIEEGNKSLFLSSIVDVHNTDVPEHDILLAGFPCQPFSIAGNRKGFSDEGRGNMFFEILRILIDKKPQAIFLENVKNLVSHNKGNTFSVIENTLKSLGYKITYKVLNTMKHANIPQNRERIYIVGFLDKNALDKFTFPESIELTKTISEFLDEDVDQKYYYNNKPLYDKLKDSVVNTNTVYQWRRKYVRENKKGVCPTLTANMGTGGHNVPIVRDIKGIRKLTPRECARLQGFPDTYRFPEKVSDSILYKQIGNSVSIPVVQRIARNLKDALS